MDQALIQVGLPVRCKTCLAIGFVKPGTKHGGWGSIRLLGRRKWYCPKHAKKAKEFNERMEDNYKTPQPGRMVEKTQEELYKLLD